MSWIETPDAEFFGAFNLTVLKMDEAWMNVTNLSDQALYLYQRSTDCFSVLFDLTHFSLPIYCPSKKFAFMSHFFSVHSLK